MSTSPGEFFNTGGGTLNAEAPSYVSRKADDELYDGLSRGEYCYVLTSRQMGKSSLAIRIAERLRAEETAVAQLDLTTVGHALNPEQWYYGLLFSLGEQLDLQGELEEFWQSHEDLGPLQRWMQAVHDVILERCPGPVVLIIDEIDYVRRLPFSTDELFAAIRACFNRRADDPPMRRLSFCLLGTVTPSELIEDPNTTPFNIGRRIELNDFTEAEAATLARGLGRDEATAARLMRRVYHWTGGQPYLTQSLCRAVAEAPQVVDATGVDRICQSLFFTGRACATDKNLQFVGGHIVGREDRLRDGRPGGDQPPPGGADELSPEDRRRAGLLDLYAKVRRGRTVPDDETSPLIGALRLSGLVRVVDGTLQVRNRIYRRVFDEAWIRSNMPRTVAQIRREAYLRGVRKAAVIAASVLGLAAVAVYYYWDTYLRLEDVLLRQLREARRGVRGDRASVAGGGPPPDGEPQVLQPPREGREGRGRQRCRPPDQPGSLAHIADRVLLSGEYLIDDAEFVHRRRRNQRVPVGVHPRLQGPCRLRGSPRQGRSARLRPALRPHGTPD